MAFISPAVSKLSAVRALGERLRVNLPEDFRFFGNVCGVDGDILRDASPADAIKNNARTRINIIIIHPIR